MNIISNMIFFHGVKVKLCCVKKFFCFYFVYFQQRKYSIFELCPSVSHYLHYSYFLSHALAITPLVSLSLSLSLFSSSLFPSTFLYYQFRVYCSIAIYNILRTFSAIYVPQQSLFLNNVDIDFLNKIIKFRKM